MIHITAAEGKYYFSEVATLASGQSTSVDEKIMTLDQLEDLKDSYQTGRLIMSSGDYTKVLSLIIGEKSGGGTASYPSFTGNADKVLTVNDTEDGVEWKTVSSGGGSGGGINVIEYDPSLYEITADTVVDTDFVPVNGTCTYNTTTKEIEIANPIMLNNIVRSDEGAYNAEYIGIKLNSEFNTGELTIDATNCTSTFGMVLIPPTMTLEDFLTNYHNYDYSSTPSSNPVNPSEIFGRVEDGWKFHTLSNDGYQSYMRIWSELNLMSMTLVVGSYLTTYAQLYPNMSVEEVLSVVKSTGHDPLQPFFIDLTNGVFIYNIKEYDLYFFMLAHGDADTTATLAATDKLKITHTLSEKVNAVPATAVDGDFLHIGENMIANNLLGKTILPSTFVQLYDNKTKMIIHGDQSNQGVTNDQPV